MIKELEKKERVFLLKLAKEAILERLGVKTQTPLIEGKINPSLKEKRGTFVTLHKKEELRGCIGIIEPIYPLFESIYKNAISAAFSDPRFSPLELTKLSNLKIEISVLTIPQKLEYKDSLDLLEKLKPNVHGVILSKEGKSATFLPQVWEELESKELFLSYLCQKAHLAPSAWKDGNLIIKTYSVEKFSQKLSDL